MRFAKVGDRVRIKNNLNGCYKDMLGKVINVFPSGTATVAIDSKFFKELDELGFSFKPRITLGNYEVLAKICVSTLEVE